MQRTVVDGDQVLAVRAAFTLVQTCAQATVIVVRLEQGAVMSVEARLDFEWKSWLQTSKKYVTFGWISLF